MIGVFDLKFENKLIKEYANEIYEDFISHANRRNLDERYVVEMFIKEINSIAKKNGVNT